MRGQAGDECDAVEARLTGQSIDGELDGNWQKLHCDSRTRDITGSLTVAAGGWYRIEVRALRGGKPCGEQVVAHVGVGEVFIVAGQSNAGNWGSEKQTTTTGRVSTFDGSQWRLAEDPRNGSDGDGGSFIPPFGDALHEKCGVPVAVAGVAAGGTSVREWLPKGERMRQPPTTGANVTPAGPGEWESTGALFDRLMARLTILGTNGLRAVLWHQGESDSGQVRWGYPPTVQITGQQYTKLMEILIRASRRQAGWDVPWIVALATLHSPTEAPDEEFRSAQRALWQSGLAAEGPDSDTLNGDNRCDVHFNGKGLRAHGQLWAGKVGAFLEVGAHPCASLRDVVGLGPRSDRRDVCRG